MDEYYQNLLKGEGHVILMNVLSLFLLALLRMAPIVVLAPFFGGKQLPTASKMVLMMCLVAIILPHLMTISKFGLTFDMHYLALGLKEVLVGFFLGFFITIPFQIAQSAGTLIDHQRGSATMMTQDPSLSVQTSPIGQLYNYVLIAIYFLAGGPILFLDAVMQSYTLIPPDQFLSLQFLKESSFFSVTWLHLLTYLMSMAIQLSAPALVALLMAETFIGIANRLAPQVQVSFLLMSLKSMIGILLLWVSWFVILRQMEKESIDWTEMFPKLIKSLAS